MSKSNWQKIYSQGQQLNLYPYDFIVSNFFTLKAQLKDKQIKVLDLGCGGGNHSLFCAENGAQVVAVDYSESALAVVRDRAKNRGLHHNIVTEQADFENFSIDHEGFDLVIDRLSVTNVAEQFAQQVFDKVYDAMASNGKLLSCVFSSKHSHKDYGQYDDTLNVWNNFSDGIFKELLTANFYQREQLESLYQRYKIDSLKLELDTELVNEPSTFAVWKVIASKYD